MIRLLLLWLAALAFAPSGLAHEIRPAYLQIREIEPQVYDLLWKTPARGEMRLALNISQPKECTNLSERRGTIVGGAVIQRWRVRCEGGIVAKPIGIENLSHTLTDVIVRFEPLEGSPRTLRVRPDDPVALIPDRQPWSEVAVSYFALGVEHILLGFDHLLFVLALLLLVRDAKRLIGAITAFTIAHSLTLAGTTFGWIRLASAPLRAARRVCRLAESCDSTSATWNWPSRAGRRMPACRWPLPGGDFLAPVDQGGTDDAAGRHHRRVAHLGLAPGVFHEHAGSRHIDHSPAADPAQGSRRRRR